MPGLFNVENALAAIATAMVLDIPFKNILQWFKKSLEPVVEWKHMLVKMEILLLLLIMRIIN